jgi:3-deoxy-D-manno-octulosonic-acid transferase
VALVGGGFGKGIHNILEPAVYGIPVLFGPNHRKALEAAGLLSSGGAFAYQNGDDLCRQLLELHQNSIILQRSGEAAASFVAQRFGATSAVLRKVIA